MPEADIPTREAEGTMFRANPARTGAYVTRGPMGPKVRVTWRYEMEEPRIEASPAVSGRAVYLGSRGPLHAIDAETGEPLWHTEVDGFFRSSPTITDSTVYVGSWDGHLYAVDAATGEEKWTFKTGSKIYATPAVAGGRVYISSNDNHVYAVDAASGQEIWRFETDSGPVSPLIPRISSPAVAEGTVYIGSLGGSVYALDAATGEARWTVEIGGKVGSSPTVAGGVVYVGNDAEDYHDGGYIYALGAEDGGLRWRFDTGERVGTSSPAIANGTLYVGTMEGTLYGLE